MGLPPVAVGCVVFFKIYSRVKHQCLHLNSLTWSKHSKYLSALSASLRHHSRTPRYSARQCTHSKNSRWFPGRYFRKSRRISVRGVSGIRICRRLSVSGIILSFAPDSPRKYRRSGETPSYKTPFGNIDWEVIPKINLFVRSVQGSGH